MQLQRGGRILFLLLSFAFLSCSFEPKSDGSNSGESIEDASDAGNDSESEDGGTADPVDYIIDADGTYLVYTPAGLQAWNAAVQSNDTLSCTLKDDIDMSGEDWTPIGASILYKGIFDGGGHTIYNLFIESSETNVGFFGYIESKGTVKNLVLEKPNVSNISETSDDFSFAGGIAGYNTGSIENCTISDGTVSATGNDSFAGGIAGYNSNGTIAGCANGGTVSATGDNSYAGGIAGYNSEGTVDASCTNTGTVTGSNYGEITGNNA